MPNDTRNFSIVDWEVAVVRVCTSNHLQWASTKMRNIFPRKGQQEPYSKVVEAIPKGVMEQLVEVSDTVGTDYIV